MNAEFVERQGDIGQTVAAAGRLADLIVFASSRSRWEMPFRPILDACLKHTGRPILVAPPIAPESVGLRIAVAWNDTPEAARALAAAMPFLERATNVTILTGRSESGPAASADPNRVVDYLALHEISAKAKSFSVQHRRVAREIIDSALADQADLLVLGSVIHSRAHSLVFGSLTEQVLKAPKLNALLVP